jgi:hypothetical protein
MGKLHGHVENRILAFNEARVFFALPFVLKPDPRRRKTSPRRRERLSRSRGQRGGAAGIECAVGSFYRELPHNLLCGKSPLLPLSLATFKPLQKIVAINPDRRKQLRQSKQTKHQQQRHEKGKQDDADIKKCGKPFRSEAE